ncbi:RagB/SusD family nutrient uptake outer membrane protein [Polaribacter sp. Hel1_85]|uniref:RagB/SusD family nutrient uptake outer membrane protein n=1 Tax=Polaribacter sp. Hel1_85 TaxID=1250005 RepID=UPI00052B8323|nr:RagB/SusD family nutrient uptake outer membrane protein [Polaribacter sp. Hel1_85]KGL58777.1 SusD/RagB family lipoprotein [Polaribacter sp. Hel1_85]
MDVEPSYKLNDINGITNEINARSAVSGIYSTIISSSFGGSYFSKLTARAGFTDWTSSELTNQFTASSVSYAPWQFPYETVNASNFAISGIERLNDDQIDAELKKELLGEARLLRAWAHLQIFHSFGHWWTNDDSDPDGLLFRDEVVTLANITKARLNVGDSYLKIYEDLDYAIANAPSFTSSRYMCKEYAKVVKAKTLLYRAGFNDETTGLDEALTLVNEVLNTSIPGFAMQGDLAQVYEDSWDSQENLFSGYLEENNRAGNWASYFYKFSLPFYEGNRNPHTTTETLDAGLRRGYDWFSVDPRWDVVTGTAWGKRTRETFTFTKVARLGDYGEDNNTSSTPHKYNTYYFRYPQLYIMKSELLARTGATITAAIAPINTMRGIRTNPIIPSLNPTTQQELMESIFKEYFIETFIENESAYFGSTRFRDASGARWIENLRDDGQLELFRLCYPIPINEINANSLMHQNDQYE